MARIPAASVEIPIDRQGRVVIPRHLRSALGPVPGPVRASRVDGGLLIEQTPAGEVVDADDGLPLLVWDKPLANEDVLAAIDAERTQR